ncbi:proline:sodium symporter PutP [Klebsiella variicola subsp. variicola]|nr:proline:sodium symporter PutP [Klebsiella variicola subsp. variicola]
MAGWACSEIIPGFIFGSLGLWSLACWIKRRRPACSSAFAEADAHYHTPPPVRATAE